MQTIIPVRWLVFGLMLALSGLPVLAQTTPAEIIKITYPQTRAVFQRDNNNLSTIFISGHYNQPVDSLQARVVAENAGQGTTSAWTTIQRGPQGGVFRGKITASNGWYRLQVQAFGNGAVLAIDEVRKVGVGEVFIITGQSNAQGLDGYGGIGATEDRVNCVSYNNITANSLGDPPAPAFEQLGANSVIGPRGKTAWCWGVLGDLLVQQYNVPVLFMNTAWESTTSQNWNESAQNRPTAYWFNNSLALPPGMPYANLVISLRYYASLQGLRAILWQQGESDNIPFSIDRNTYRTNLQYLINKTREDTQRYPAWILARSSLNSQRDPTCVARCANDPNCINGCPNNYRTWSNIINGQNEIINTYNNNVYPGPQIDNIQVPRVDGVHFSGAGLRQLGQAWYQSMTPIFFSTSLPLLPQEQPTVTVTCSTSALTLALPTGFASYTWTTGQTGRTITVSQPGSYQATLKDGTGNTFLSPLAVINAPIVPPTPVISLPGSATAATLQQQVCADSVLTVTSTAPLTNALRWNTGTTGRSIRVSSAGNYTVQASSVYGCTSAPSAAVNLTVRSRLTAPAVAQVGPYSLLATLPAAGLQTDLFDWRRGTEILATPTGRDFKARIGGTYSARARNVFTLAGNNLTCYSAFSAPATFSPYETGDGLVVYPNPTTGGTIAVETADDWTDATIRVISLNGKVVYTSYIGLLRERKVLDVSGLPGGLYIVDVKGTNMEVTRRVWIMN
jgi:hypothetical protein